MKITSDLLKDYELFPLECTGYGTNIAPDFNVTELPEGTKSIAITMDDLDIPFIAAYNHWLCFNIEPIEHLDKGLSNSQTKVEGLAYGKNKYAGPKIPPFLHGYHRYRFVIYALDTKLHLGQTARKKDFIKAINSHVLEFATINGIAYRRKDHIKMLEKVNNNE